METKTTPPAVVISIVVLGLLSLFGAYLVSYEFGFWYERSSLPFSWKLLGVATLYSVLPPLAIIDMFRRHSFGRRLAILILLVISALLFRGFVDMVSLPVRYRAAGSPTVMLFFSTSISLAALALSLGFDKKVNAFFSTQGS